MPKSSKPPDSPAGDPRSRSRREYRVADDGGTLFRTFLDVRAGRRREPRQVAIEGHFRKMTPELEKQIAHMLADMLVGEYRRREAAGKLDEPGAPREPVPDPYTDYVRGLSEHLWTYRRGRFADRDTLFDPKHTRLPSPPVFAKDADHWNVIVSNEPQQAAAVWSMIGPKKRHRWFRSMKSSQALTLSVFGNLKMLGHTDVLETVKSDGNAGPAFGLGPIRPDDIILEYAAKLPGERTSTSVDVLVKGASTVCIECKLSEQKVGPCSRPALPADKAGHCDGANPLRTAGLECGLAKRGVKYWDMMSDLVQVERWKARDGCPMRAPYQLVRNMLAARAVDNRQAHALLIYDARNPAFWPTRDGVFETLQGDLLVPSLLRRCSWQAILAAIDTRQELRGLVAEIELKYALMPWPDRVGHELVGDQRK
jgi:hypothetical protein